MSLLDKMTAAVQDDEIAKIKVGGAGLTAEIPIRHSQVERWRQLFQPQPLDQSIAVRLDRTTVHVVDGTDGSIDWWLSIINLSKVSVRIHAMSVSQILANGREVPRLAEVAKPPQSPIKAMSTETLYIRSPLTAEGINSLFRNIGPARNEYSSPNCRIDVEGSVDLLHGKRLSQTRFQLYDVSPFLILPPR